MVTEFAFDIQFFESKSLTTPGQSATHDSILQLWRDHGVLISNKKKFEQHLDLIKKFPVKYHQRWKEALEYNRVSMIDDDWKEFSDYENFTKLTSLCPIFKTAVADDEIGKIISENEDAVMRCNATGFELLGAGAIVDSVNFQESRMAGRTEIPFGSNARTIWETKIQPLAKYSKNITIIDRYLFTRILERRGHGPVSSGALGFLRMLSEIGQKFNVKIISGGDEKNSERYHLITNYFMVNAVKSPPIAKALKSLTLVSNHDHFFRDYAHERFIRFDSHVCEIGLGLQVFEDHPTPMTSFSLKHISDTFFQDRENLSSKQILWRELSM